MNSYITILLSLFCLPLLGQLPHGFQWGEKEKTVRHGQFESVVRSDKNHLCFETDILIIRDVSKQLTPALIEQYNLIPHPWIPNLFTLQTKVDNRFQLDEYKNELANVLQVEVFYNQVFTLDACTNDPNFNRQWAIENLGGPLHYNGTPGADMNVSGAWSLALGNGVKVALLDSGVDTLHPDLAPNLLPGLDAYADSISDTHGYPTPNFSSDGHGTACAGIIAAVQDNAIGTSGIAPLAKVIPIRIFYYLQYAGNIGVQPFTSTLGLLNGASYAWRIADCDIMSTSAGLSELFIQALQIDTQIINDEIDSAFYQGRNGRGVAMFFSAGNDDINDVLWPANLSSTMAVGASDMCDQRKHPTDCSGENWGSTFGDHLDFMAPGVKIATSDMLGANGFTTNALTLTFNGTSAACPNAAAVAALLYEANPNLTNEQIREILSWTAEKVTYSYDSIAPLGAWNMEAGYGRINALGAVQLAMNTTQIGSNDLDNVFEFGQNPCDEILIHNKSNQSQTIDLSDCFGKVIKITIEPRGTFQWKPSPGTYFAMLKGTTKKIIVI